jgi:hypothetical protein
MIKCPRCNLEQEESPVCEYCGLDFTVHAGPEPTAGISVAKWVARLILILAVCGAVIVAYRVYSVGTAPEAKPTVVNNSDSTVPSSSDKDLHKALKGLSGDMGIVSEITGGSSKGGIIVMVVFSIVGLAYLTYGKKSQQLLMVICGIGLMGFSYFITGTLNILLIGLALSALPFVLGRN